MLLAKLKQISDEKRRIKEGPKKTLVGHKMFLGELVVGTQQQRKTGKEGQQQGKQQRWKNKAGNSKSADGDGGKKEVTDHGTYKCMAQKDGGRPGEQCGKILPIDEENAHKSYHSRCVRNGWGRTFPLCKEHKAVIKSGQDLPMMGNMKEGM